MVIRSETFEVAVDDVLRVQVDESFQDLDNVARDQAFRQLAKVLERSEQRAVLDKPVSQTSSGPLNRGAVKYALQNDIQIVLSANETLILDDGCVLESFEQVDLVR